jgi:adenine-specific DNA-methyltransferase
MCVTIDDYENSRLLTLIDAMGKGEDVLGIVCIRNNPSGRSTVKGFAVNHEYAIFIAANSQYARLGRLQHTPAQRARYDLIDEDGQPYEIENMRKSSAESLRADRTKQHYAIYVDSRTLEVRVPQQIWDEETQSWTTKEPTKQGETKVFPIGADGVERVWSIGYERACLELATLTAKQEDSVYQIYKRKYLNEDGVLPRTWWDKPEYSARDNGTRVLRDMLGRNQPFEFPKAVAAVADCLKVTGLTEGSIAFDFFTGSGTTGHAVINLNREDGGARKFLLVEQGEYFDTVTLPRIAKVMTSPDWKDGAPKDTVQHDTGDDAGHWSRRTLPLVRVLRLERYEDSLNALELDINQPVAQQNQVQAAIELVAHDEQAQLLKYWLLDAVDAARTGAAPSAVCLSTASLNTPFDYQLTLHEPAGERLANVDMLETARLLLGLVPKKQRDMVDAQGQRHQLMEAVLASDLARGTVTPKLVLLWLRTVDDERNDAAAQAEHDWLVSTVQTHFNRPIADYGTVFHNRSAFWPQGQQGVSLDALLAERMMERAR